MSRARRTLPILLLLSAAVALIGALDFGQPGPRGTGVVNQAAAQDKGGPPSFMRIATGGVNGTYFPIGGIIANAISSPPGSRSCDSGGSCGVPNLIAVAVSSDGSVANVRSIQAGTIDSGFAQTDVVAAAFEGTGAFTNFGPSDKLRVIASLYAERVQLVVSAASGIETVADLKGRRVSIDEPGSGTLLIAREFLEAYGLTEADVAVEYLKPGPAASKMLRDELDAFFIVAGVPTSAVGELVDSGEARILPLSGPEIDQLLVDHPFLANAPIPEGTYEGQPEEIPTFGVVAQWIVSSDVSEDLVRNICMALWNDATRVLLDGGHPTGHQIRISGALDAVAIPLHPGAEACYRELGLRE